MGAAQAFAAAQQQDQQRMMEELHQRAAAQAAAAVGLSPSAALAAMPLLPDMQRNSQVGFSMSAVTSVVRCCP